MTPEVSNRWKVWLPVVVWAVLFLIVGLAAGFDLPFRVFVWPIILAWAGFQFAVPFFVGRRYGARKGWAMFSFLGFVLGAWGFAMWLIFLLARTF